MAEIDASLRRLGTDYVDLYQIHRWDYETPIEETLEALHDVVKAGKARYIGASSMYAWQFAQALYTAERHGWTRFVSMQNHYNLLYREEEREMLPLCRDRADRGHPLVAAGARAADARLGASSSRQETDEFGKRLYAVAEDADRQVVERVAEIAAQRGHPARTGGAGLAGCTSRVSLRQSSARASRTTSTMLWPHCRSRSPSRRSVGWRSRTSRTRCLGLREIALLRVWQATTS